MTSIFENTHSKVTVHVLHDDTLTNDNRQKFIRTAEKYSQSVEFHDVSEYSKQLGKDIEKVSGNWTIGCCYRLAIPDIITSVNKIIYLDCDTIVNLDIKELWDIDLEGKSLAGVIDIACERIKLFSDWHVRIRFAGGRVDSYINSGVIVMNLAKFREHGKFFDVVFEWLMSHSHLPIFPDQDALNSIFLGDIKLLDGKFNKFYVPNVDQDISGCIAHTCGAKPWREFMNIPQHILYWDMYLRSAWGENVTPLELVRTLASISSSSQHYHQSARQCLKPVTKAILRKLSLPGFRHSVMMILRHMYYRLTHYVSKKPDSKS